ncbi:MAG: hypothetical protein ACJAVW_003048 [Spirosomataceae bacterium]|jgi:hypothetical protein
MNQIAITEIVITIIQVVRFASFILFLDFMFYLFLIVGNGLANKRVPKGMFC